MLSDRLKRLRREKQMTQTQLSEKLAVSQQAVAKWESGLSFPDMSTLVKLSSLFSVTTDYLLGAQTSDPYFFDAKQVRIIGAVQAGYNSVAIEENLGYETANVRNPEEYRYFTVKGDSMEPYIHDGDLALVRLQPTLENGDLGVVIFGDNEATIKRFHLDRDGVVLEPFNEKYAKILINREELEKFIVFGKVIETKTRW